MKGLYRYLTLIGVVLVLLLSITSNSPYTPPASAIGCDPGIIFFSEAYYSSLKGFAGLDTWQAPDGVTYELYIMEPGSTASLTFGYTASEIWPERNTTIKPTIFLEKTPPNFPSTPPSWLNVSFSLEEVVLQPDGKVNVTAALNISKDAPQGEYMLGFGGRPVYEGRPSSCVYGGRLFILRVGTQKPPHVFTLTYISSRSTDNASVTQFSEGNQLEALIVNLRRNSSVELDFMITSEYPIYMHLRPQLTDMSSRRENITILGSETFIRIDGPGWDTSGDVIYPHTTANISLILSTKGAAEIGGYATLFVVYAYPLVGPLPEDWRKQPELETAEVPIFVSIRKNVTSVDAVKKTATYRVISTVTVTNTTTITVRSTTKETVTKTTPTTTTSTLTNTATTTLKETITRTSIEKEAEPSVYAWAIGTTALAIILATVIILRKRKI